MAESREYRSKATISPTCDRRLRTCWSLIHHGSFVLGDSGPTSSRESVCAPQSETDPYFCIGETKFWQDGLAEPDPTKRDLDEQFSAVTIGCKKNFLFQLGSDSEVKG
ncbi:hypothetical protein K443DRAFT_80851 [Laccaria amethystina LaAM-08-1]|uniref:Uncharacterized protein n=1 Tax=Laccaria amethystina LaAM-08-1 TaxID=1095629 RepID=A0A0C9YPY3_9AGAR|nr:hypothetical protein K443DRAFT_80851 [Laccaria amethystina LaAM-08-1]